MKILRFTYPPSGRISIEDLSQLYSDSRDHYQNEAVRMEIYNQNGELVYIITDRTKIKTLPLEQGFYLLREKDTGGNIIKNGKLIFQ